MTDEQNQIPPGGFDCMTGEPFTPLAEPDSGDLVAIPDIDPISDPRNADGLIKQLRHAAITDSNATTASPYVCKLLVFAANTIAVLSSNTPCCQDWENCRDRCVPLAEYWKKQASTIAALREEVSRLTENQRQQDSATAFVMERDEKERDALRREVEEYKSEYFRVHNLKMDAIEARLAAERELAACKENAERYRWLRDCDTEDIPTMGGELMAREALDEHIDAAIKAARKV